jgi:hypothetical protein
MSQNRPATVELGSSGDRRAETNRRQIAPRVGPRSTFPDLQNPLGSDWCNEKFESKGISIAFRIRIGEVASADVALLHWV